MKRLVALPLAAGYLLALAVPGAVAGAPAERSAVPLAGVVVSCPSADYTVVSGWADVVSRVGVSADGDVMLSETDVLREVIAEDGDGGPYAIRGGAHNDALWRAGADPGEDLPSRATFAETLQIVAIGAGGTVGSVNLVHHLTYQAGHVVLNEFDFGACSESSNPD
jgi:hypothetical protein